ncbi:MAG: CsgG/HfaB family protein [Spirochaetota bacterium]
MARIIVCLSLILTAALHAEARRSRVGVLDFTPVSVSAADARVVGDMFRGEVVSSGAFEVLDRNNMNSILKEQSFQMSGCTESACAVKIGKMLNMEYMLYGTLSKLGTAYIIQAEMVNIETSQITLSVKEKFGALENADDAIVRIVNNVRNKVADFHRENAQKRKENMQSDSVKSDTRPAEDKKDLLLDSKGKGGVKPEGYSGATQWSSFKWGLFIGAGGVLLAGGTLNLLGFFQDNAAVTYHDTVYLVETNSAAAALKYTEWRSKYTASLIEYISAYSLYAVGAGLLAWWFFTPDVPVKRASVTIAPLFAADPGIIDGMAFSFTYRF